NSATWAGARPASSRASRAIYGSPAILSMREFSGTRTGVREPGMDVVECSERKRKQRLVAVLPGRQRDEGIEMLRIGDFDVVHIATVRPCPRRVGAPGERSRNEAIVVAMDKCQRHIPAR